MKEETKLIIAMSFIANHIYSFSSGYEMYREKNIYVAVGTITAALCNVLLNILMIPSMGAFGASLATLISYILLAAFHRIISSIILKGYPEIPPKILTKSNFCTPSLMDGRDLLKDICPNWNSKSGLKPILEGILPFLSRVINARGYKFYGTFHLGSVYNLKNFDNMIVGK